jgi:hypothetical protein
MNHSNEGIWEQPWREENRGNLPASQPVEIFDFNWSFDHTRLLLTRGNVNSHAVLLSNLTESIPFLGLAIRWAHAVLGNGSCLVARCLLTRSGRFCRSVLRRQIFVLQPEFSRPWPNRCVPLK